MIDVFCFLYVCVKETNSVVMLAELLSKLWMILLKPWDG